jgi:hypothetical protein
MGFNKLTGIAEQPAKADKSAVCAIMYFQKLKWIIEEALAAHRPTS